MNNPDLIRIFLSMFMMHLPTLVVCLVAGFVILTRWRQAASGSLWALLGFGFALILCFAMPLVHTLIQHWMFQGGAPQSRMWALSAFSVVTSVLHAVIYVFLLVAIFAGRPKPDEAKPPPYSRP